MERLSVFRQQASERDRIVLVFATARPMSETDRRAVGEIRLIGSQRLSNIFDVEDISLQTIWETRDTVEAPDVSLPVSGNFVDPALGVRVGTIPLTQMYGFWPHTETRPATWTNCTRRTCASFLAAAAELIAGSPRHSVIPRNSSASTTTASPSSCPISPLVLTALVSSQTPTWVNGCQTTRTIWDVLRQRLDSGGTGESEELADWRRRAEQGVVVAKIVKGDSAQITNITRYTNSQNAVRSRTLSRCGTTSGAGNEWRKTSTAYI